MANACSECETAISARATRCRPCATGLRRVFRPCRACGGPRKVGARTLCGPCYAAGRAAAAARRLVCPDCGGPKQHPESARCKQCYDDARRFLSRECPICGGRKSGPSKACLTCFRTLRAGKRPGRGTQPIDGRRFKAAIEAPALEWSLSALSDVSGVPVRTLQCWMQGLVWAEKEQLDRVIDVLQWDLCPTCGMGWVDTHLRPRVTRAVARVRSAKDPKAGAFVVDRSGMRRARLAGGFVFDPAAVAIHAPNGVEIRLSSRELQVLAVALDTCRNRWAFTAEVGDVLGIAPHNTRILGTRIRNKVAAAGFDAGVFWRSERYRGWYLVVAESAVRAEASA